jgi:hypothetical protein
MVLGNRALSIAVDLVAKPKAGPREKNATTHWDAAESLR